MVIDTKGFMVKSETLDAKLEKHLDHELMDNIQTYKISMLVELPTRYGFYTPQVQRVLTSYRQAGWDVALVPWEMSFDASKTKYGNDTLEFTRNVLISTHYAEQGQQLKFPFTEL